MNRILLLIGFLFLFVGCENCDDIGGITCRGILAPSEEYPQSTIELYSELPMDENGFYHFEFPSYTDYSTNQYGNNGTYSNVKYKTNALERVWWNSPDSISVEYQNQTFYDPIINYSTYADDNGDGQQMYYIWDLFIGDTLSIYGSIVNYENNTLIHDVLYVIIEDNE